jgi:ribosomal protein S18 acetylase RimI-like enzyme
VVPVSIREYRRSDRPHLARCLDAIADHMVGLDPWRRRIRTSEHSARWVPFFLRLVRGTAGFILVAEVDGEPAGVAIGSTYTMRGPDRTKDRPTKVGSIAELAVLAPWRGRGLGTLLLRECERRFRAAGCDQLGLATFAHNRGARRLYAREGYEERYLLLGKQLGPPKRRWPPVREPGRRSRDRRPPG